ncbi:MAG: exodeoxyribonuclease V subunit gamma, partial [Pseudomonadales bacterium]|nr:exodeoxyribonuclease V subunit gamma [Pseudomonadales bacterium]
MLHLHQSNRLERLADALVDRFDVPTGRHPLELEQVVVQSPGMATWLRHRWAERTGVAAAVAFPLPAVLLWRVIRALVPEVPERSPYEKQAMAWRLLPLLGPELLAEPAFAPVARYLDDDGTGLKRWQLAQRVADLFDQYLVYRPDWMARWRADPEGAAAALGEAQGWQPRLWARLVAACDGAPDRAGLQDRALARLAEDPEAAGEALAVALPPRLGLFGLSALPPAQLRLVVALAEHVDVHLYRLEPSREYWGDVVSERQRARRVAEETARGEDRGASLLETGHPLLGALGRAGRDFVDLVLEASDAPLEDTGFETPLGEALLPRLQRDVLELADAGAGQVSLPAGDDSLLFVDCHGPLREVEALHDWLLGRFQADPTLTPRDVVVMIPDIDGYAPCVEAVFGSGAEGDGEGGAARRIPFGIADRGARVESPVLEAVAALLRLPRSRLAASELLGILETPAVLRAFGLDEAGLEQLVHWIDAAGVRWGRDAAHWRSLGFPAAAPPDAPLPNTWAFGVERLLLGYAMGDEAGTFAGSLPLGGVEGGAVDTLGALLEFLRAVDAFTERLAGPHAPADWARHLSALLETFLAPDVDEELALGGVRELLARLVEAQERLGVTEPLSAAVIEAALEPVLRAPAGAHRFLGGGVTFCTLLPMRAIPFRVVCLLGMNEGAYPRRETPLGFDLMAAAPPRRGDRARRLEDRFLFLEAILSAREHLYVSWTGRSAYDDSVQPPSVVVSELRDVLARRFLAADGGKVLDALTIRHPLQPFSPRYGAEAGLPPTYSELWTREDGAPALPLREALPPFEEVEPPPLRALVGFFLDPSGSFLAERLGVRFGPEAVAAEDDEPFLL